MARSVESISAVTAEAAHGLTEIADATTGLDRLTAELRALVDRFRTDTPASADVGGDGYARRTADRTGAALISVEVPPVPAGVCPVHH